MADEAQRAGTRTSNLQSTIAKINNAKKQQAASSSAAAKSGSTTTPTVTSTPKVTNTAKAMPSLTRVDISKLAVPTVTPTVTTPREQAMNLLGSKTRVEPLRVADKGNLLDTTTEKKDIQSTTLPLTMVKTALSLGGQVAKTVTNNLYEQGLDWVGNKFKQLDKTRQRVEDVVGKGTIDLFNYIKEDVKSDWEQGEGIGMVKDTILNTVQGVPRGIARAEYGLAELLDWAVDSKYGVDMRLDTRWSDDLKESIKKDLDYWENTRTYKKVKETESFSDFLKNPLMYAGGTLGEMLPMFINAWVAVPTTFAQIYGETYQDYSQDESLKEAGLNDNQVRLMSLGVAGVNTIIELGSDLVQGLMPWTKTIAKTTEKEVRKSLTKPITKVLSRFAKGGLSEGFEEVLQNEMQDQVAGFEGSDRDLPTWADRLTTFGISSIIGWILQGGNVVVNVKQNKEIETAFNEWSEAVDKIAPGVSRDDKVTLFSSIVAAEVEDANMSEDRISKYEAQTTELYNRIDELTNKLNTTTNEEEKQEINRQIEDANQKIKNIDEIINKSNKVIEDVNKQLQELSQQREASEAENIMSKEQASISDKAVSESKPLEKMTDDELLDAMNYWLKNEPTTPQEKQRQKEINYEISNRMENYELPEERRKSIEDLTFDVDTLSLMESAAVLVEVKKLYRAEDDRIKANKYWDLKEAIEGKTYKLSSVPREEAQTEKRDEQSILPETQIDSKNFFRNMQKRMGINLDDYGILVFHQDREHIPGLKGVKIAGLENLTRAEIMEIAKNAAEVAGVLGIDFNKIIDNAHFSVVNLKGETVEGTEGIAGKLYLRMQESLPDVLQMAIFLKDTGPEVFGHELMHLLDKEYLFRNNRLWTPSGEITKSSLLKNKKFKTYNIVGKDYEYWDTSREVLARYAEQYIAYKLDKNKYDDYTTKGPYWNDKEFKKLIPTFKKLLKENFSEFMLDKGDKVAYPEVMRKIVKLSYNQSQFKLGEQTEIAFKLAEMKTDYDNIIAEIENVKNETLRIELENEASNLYSNFEMLNKMGNEYIQMQRTTQQQQKTIDTITETIMPNPPALPQKIMYGLPYYGGSNIENGIGKMFEGESGNEDFMKSYMTEQERIKMNKRLGKFKTYGKELWNAWNDLITPAFTRIYNRAPRIAGRLLQMEADTIVFTHRYRMKAKGFVDALGKLEGEQALEVKMALLDYGALASEQTEDTIQEYKKQEVAKLKEVLKKNGFKEEDINNMFEVLDSIGRQYQESGLDVTLTDLYFPRVVKDYEGLIDYMSRVSGEDIKVNKRTLLRKINDIQSDPEMTEEEKEARIRSAISIEFKQPSTTSKHGKERKLGLLSDWGPGIYAYYENPIQSIDHYIVTMVNAIQRQLLLGGMRSDANIDEAEMINQGTAESVSTILGKLVEDGMVDESDVEIIQRNILAVLNKRPSPKVVRAITDITYISTITNFISAINQLDDLGVTIIKDKAGFKEVVKTIFNKAGIKYDDLGLDDAYEMFREGMGISNWLFKKSGFNFIDRLGKVSFVNTAWESLKSQAKNKKTRGFLYTRLESMYGKECADRMMEKIDKGDYNDNSGQIDIEILRDLLYQLGTTQPIFTSAMPVTYLNNPWVRPCYSLSSFTLKRIDMLVQGSRRINSRDGFVKAAAWLMGVSFYLALFGVAIGDVGDLLKKKKDETFIWNLINEGIDEALISGGKDVLQSWLKIWDLSEYDLKIFRQQGLKGVLLGKITPFIYDLGLDVQQAITKHDANEITDLAKYIPIFGKMVYYWCWEDLESATNKKKEEWDWGEEKKRDWGDSKEWNWGEEKEWNWD